ncbi:MAG TPA: ATP-binding protein [Bacillota bacterium]|nr:ATP-binding protein [Bacillota bacterium]
MKELLILSGKGGTGKTTIASALIRLSSARAYADCDVDAPNLHLIAGWETRPQRKDYYGLPMANIDPDTCIECGKCKDYCRFDAISAKGGYKVNPFACEGCGLCAHLCPTRAIAMEENIAGDLYLYADKERAFSTAQLKMGSGTSGLLVSQVKEQMKSAAAGVDLAIIDGSPGIGCPVIASLSGVDMVLIVAEPTISGISDMGRIINTAMKFGTRILVCINKFDTNIENSEKIQAFCQEHKLPLVGRIPFDPLAVKAINNGQSIVDIECPSGSAVRGIYNEIRKELCKRN